MTRIALLVSAGAASLLVSACGSTGLPQTSQGSTQSAGPVSTGTVAKETLIGVVLTAPVPTNETVEMVTLDGRVRASSVFTPMPIASVPSAGLISPHQVIAADGRIFYLDSKAVLHSLGSDGSSAIVASFPTSPSPEFWSFAVSPDAQTVLAIRDLLPQLAPPPSPAPTAPATPALPKWQSPLTFGQTVFKAVGGTVTTVLDTNWSDTEIQNLAVPLEMAGWDTTGPYAYVDAPLATTAIGPPSLPYGDASYLDDSGHATKGVGGTNCQLWDRNELNVLCLGAPSGQIPANVSTDLRATNGGKLFTTTRVRTSGRLSPSGDKIVGGMGDTGDTVVLSINAQPDITLATGSKTGTPTLTTLGWADNQTVVALEIPAGGTVPHVVLRNVTSSTTTDPTKDAADFGTAANAVDAFAGVVVRA